MRFTVKAFAKLNLFLDVLGKRPDGYHNIDSVMQSIDLYDEIVISDNSENTVKVTYNDPALEREDDIVYRACNAFFEYSDWRCGLDIRINKNIPLLAGLGGVSTDAAAVIKTLNIMSGKSYSEDEMIRLCASLGADMPFCYLGGTARAGSIGDELISLPTVKLHFVILKDGEKQSTGVMYNKLDSFCLTHDTRINDMISGLYANDPDKVTSSVYNAFELCWDMERMLSPFDGYNADCRFLSGSGPAVVAAFSSYPAAERCFDRLKSKGHNVYLASATEKGCLFE